MRELIDRAEVVDACKMEWLECAKLERQAARNGNDHMEEKWRARKDTVGRLCGKIKRMPITLEARAEAESSVESDEAVNPPAFEFGELMRAIEKEFGSPVLGRGRSQPAQAK